MAEHVWRQVMREQRRLPQPSPYLSFGGGGGG